MLTSLFLVTTILSSSGGVADSGPVPERVFRGQAPLVSLSSGRGTLVSADGVIQMKEADSLKELPPHGHMEVAAASEMELRWIGRGSIELIGASAFEWSGSAFGQDENDLLRIIQVSSADIEVRRGPLRLGLPGQVVLTVERGALEIEANPSGKYSIRLFGGENLRLTFPTTAGEGHMEIAPGKSMWVDPAVLIDIAEVRDLAARKKAAGVAKERKLEQTPQVAQTTQVAQSTLVEPQQAPAPTLAGQAEPAPKVNQLAHQAQPNEPAPREPVSGDLPVTPSPWAPQASLATSDLKIAVPNQGPLHSSPLTGAPLEPLAVEPRSYTKPMVVFLPAGSAQRAARSFRAPIPTPWSPVPIAAAPEPQAVKRQGVDLGLSELINGFVEYEAIDW